MKTLSARGLVVGITLVISGCSQQIPLSDSSREGASVQSVQDDLKTGDLITDLTVHSLTADVTEVRYEKPKLFTLIEPLQAYSHLLVLGMGSKAVRLGILKELSGSVQWFDPASSDLEQCLFAQTQTFSDLAFSGEPMLEAQAAVLSHEIRALCNIPDEFMSTLLLVVDNTIYLQHPFPETGQVDHHSLELDSIIVSVLGTSLMVHVDDRNNPTFAMVHHYIDEVPVVGGVQQSKRLRTEFSLKDLKKSAKALFGDDVPKTQELMPDPIQTGCTAVRADWEGEPIYISFKQIPENHTALLGDLCGVYFGRSKKLYSADAVLGSFIDI